MYFDFLVDPRIPQTSNFISSLLIVVGDMIILLTFGPTGFIAFFIQDPAIETLLLTLGKNSWIENADWKYLTCHIFLFLILFILFLQAYTAIVTVIMYCDLTGRLLKFSSQEIQNFMNELELKSKKWDRIRQNKRIYRKLTDICSSFVKETLVSIFVSRLVQKYIRAYIGLFWPASIIMSYVVCRSYSLLPNFILISVVIALITFYIVWITIHLISGSLVKFSYRFIQKGKTSVLFLDRHHPYWKMKFRSFRVLKVNAFWWYFSFDNLPNTLHNFMNLTITVLLL